MEEPITVRDSKINLYINIDKGVLEEFIKIINSEYKTSKQQNEDILLVLKDIRYLLKKK